ncbi:MAG: hypothetical protein U1E62_10150 [Alsobacter sp.]
MATLLDLLDRCISAGPTDGDLGATVIRVLRMDEIISPAAPGRIDEDDDLFSGWCAGEKDLGLEFAEDDDVGQDGDGEAEPAGRWLLAVGECG